MATPTNTSIDQKLADNTTGKITPALLRTVLHQQANMGANERVGGLKSVIYLTQAEAVAAGRAGVATLDQLDPLTCCTGTLAYVDLPPAGTAKMRVLVYDDRPAGSAGQVLAYFDGGATRNYSLNPTTGLAALKWVVQGSTEETTAQLRRYSASITDWALDETMKIALGGADTFFSANVAGGPLPAPTVAGLSTANWKASLVSGTSAPPAPILYFDAATRRLTASHPQYTAAQLEFCFPGQAYVNYSNYALDGVQVGDMFHEANIFHFRVKATASVSAGAVAGNPQIAAGAPTGAPAQLSAALTLAQAQAINHSQVVAGCLYMIDFGLDQAGHTQTISLLGISAKAFSIRGICETNGVQIAVRVNVDSGVFGEEASYNTLVVTDVSMAKKAAVVSAVANAVANGGLASAFDSSALTPSDGLASSEYVGREFFEQQAGYLYKCHLDSAGQAVWLRLKVQ